MSTQVKRNDLLVIAGSSVGTVFEWYDFFLYGSLAIYLTRHFFSGVNETTGFIFALLAFAAGFLVRPFGALVFGRLGDIWGRKNTFLVTMLLMGASTFLVGLIPSYAQIGVLAPLILVTFRLIQGLALGGQYGGAATYVAEHAPKGRLGFYTSWIQTCATLGLFLSLVVILVTRTQMSTDDFADWGWRIPFLVSAVLLLLSLFIRQKLGESPVFKKMHAEGKTSKSPLTEAFTNKANLRIVLVAMIIVAGQAVVWYTCQFYALFFIERVLKVEGALTNELVVAGLLIGTPFLVLFGWLSDKIGRKPIILAGFLLAALTLNPLFHALTQAANPALAEATARAPITVIADPADCSVQFDPVGSTVFNRSCDIAKSYLAKAGLPYENETGAAGTTAQIRIGTAIVETFHGRELSKADFAAQKKAWDTKTAAALADAGYPAAADSAKVNKLMVIAIMAVMMVYSGMVYGPLAAMLVEMFPAKIRYTSMSLPYHIGNGWFGGLLPTISFAMVAATGDMFYGLWYPIGVAAIALVLGIVLLRETKGNSID